jgi:Tol biopolymer transport system component
MNKSLVWRLLALVLLVTATGALAQPSEIRPGQLAIVGVDSNVYRVAEDGAVQALTSDAGRVDDILRFYQWPTWSESGSLAFFGAQLQRPADVQFEAWVARAGEAAEQIYSAPDETFTYAFWSPAPCAAGGACDSLAALIGVRGEPGFTLRLVPVDGSRPRRLGQGTPFYFDWSPDGARMAWHRDNESIELANAATGRVSETVAARSGAQAAPAWSPDGAALAYGVSEGAGDTTALAVFDGDSERVLVAGLEGVISFAWSPDGRALAYTEEDGPLVIIDAVTGEEQARTVETDVLAFFWSPVENRLAVLVPDQGPAGSFSAKRAAAPAQQFDPHRWAWTLFDPADGASVRLASFTPTREQAYLVAYFEQFSRSHRVWSPDGSRLVYGEQLSATRPVVQVIDLDEPGSPPRVVAQGVIGIWSFE